jgi:diguanylate cyclase (GGDEF)-like protein
MAALRPHYLLPSGLWRAARTVRGWQFWTVSAPLRAYLLGVIAVAAGASGVALARTRGYGTSYLLGLALLACAVIAIESTRRVKETHGELVRDLQSVWMLAIAVALPPVFAFLAPIPLTAYKIWRLPGAVAYRRVFSGATYSLGYGFASVLFHAIPASAAGPFPRSSAHALSWTVSVAACGLLGWIINDGLLVVAIKLSDPASRIRDLVGSRESLTSDLLELSLAVSLTLVVRINPVLMALALPSVVLCKRSIMRSQLVSQARIDAKTGLLNAGTWQREAQAEFFRAMRGRMPLALAMVNIDHFRDVNDMAGRLVHDQLIRDIAGMLRDQLPGDYLIGRFGSEEFAILLPQTSRDEAQRISERLRDYIAAEPIAIESGSQEGFVFRLTVSIGVAVLNESRRALAELIGAADTALGQAKSTGWSKVYVLPDGSDEPETS